MQRVPCKIDHKEDWNVPWELLEACKVGFVDYLIRRFKGHFAQSLSAFIDAFNCLTNMMPFIQWLYLTKKFLAVYDKDGSAPIHKVVSFRPIAILSWTSMPYVIMSFSFAPFSVRMN